jgi:multiple sugar transport system permease protein
MRGRRRSVRLAKGVAVAAILVWSLAPIVFMVMSSFKPGQDIFAVPPRWSFQPTLAHYATLWAKWPGFFSGLWNSLIITAGATLLVIVASTMAGFAYSRTRTPFMQRSATFLIVVRLLPPIVVTLPLFGVVNLLGLNDTHLILVLLYATFFVSLGTILMRTFIDQIPYELDEAAKVDGAGGWTILWTVIRPLARQGMMAVSVFVIVYAWNEFLFAFIFTSTKAKTAPLVISEMMGSMDGVDWGVLFAATTVQLLPVLLFVMVMQKHLVAGLTGGAVKG